MDKRVFVAAGVSVLILILWAQLFPAPRPEPGEGRPELVEGPQRPTAEGPTGPRDPQPDDRAESGAEDSPALAEAVRATTETRLQIETELFGVTLTNRGAVATSWTLTDDTTGGEPLELLPQSEPQKAQTLGIDLDDRSLADELRQALFEVERISLPGGSGRPGGERVEFTWSDGRGIEVRKRLTFREGSYMVDVELDVTDRGRRLPAKLVLGPGFGAQEDRKDRATTYYYEAILWDNAGQVTHTYKKKLDAQPLAAAAAFRWAGLEDQYFAAIVVPNESDVELRWRTVELTPLPVEGEQEAGEPVPMALMAVSVPSAGAQLFVGPKKFRLLESLGSKLEHAVWFSSYGFLAWISRFLFSGLLWIHAHTIGNWGLTIILATFLLRLLLFPVNQYSMVSMKKTQLQMQRLQPKIKAIKNKYKKNKDAESRAKMNQETMDMYKREGVNPMGGISGCLPMLAQFPILMGFYFMLIAAVELRGAPFVLWIRDLSLADPYWILPLAMGATMFAQQKMAMSKVKDPVQQQQQKFMMIMPFVFTWICMQMPAGMVLYWFANNLLGIGQQWLVNRQTTRLEAAAQKA